MRSPTSSGKCGGTARDDAFFFLTGLLPATTKGGSLLHFWIPLWPPLLATSFLRPRRQEGKGNRRMPAKYLGALAEDRRPDFHRQVGCVTGILQAFDRRHPLASSHKRLLPPAGSPPCSAFSSLAAFSVLQLQRWQSSFCVLQAVICALDAPYFNSTPVSSPCDPCLECGQQRAQLFSRLRSGPICDFSMDKQMVQTAPQAQSLQVHAPDFGVHSNQPAMSSASCW